MTPKKKRSEMDPEELERVRRKERLSAYRRQAFGGGLVPAGRMQAAIRHWVDDLGITQAVISKQSGMSLATIEQHYVGHNSVGPLLRCSRDTARAVLRLNYGPEDRQYWPAAGIRRRLQALVAAGYTTRWLATEIGKTYQQVSAFIRGFTVNMETSRVERVFGDRVIETYDKYIDVDPASLGHKLHAISYARTTARKGGYAPAHCWDADTLDDPQAIPEWTGRCGTRDGWDIHIREDIPLCDPCRKAQGVDERVKHVLSDINEEMRVAHCDGCGHLVDIIQHGTDSKGRTRIRCGPHIRGLHNARNAKKRHQDAEIDRLDAEGKSGAEIAAILHVTTRTITRRRAERKDKDG